MTAPSSTCTKAMLTELPFDVLFVIFELLSIRDLCKLGEVIKLFMFSFIITN